VILRRRGAGSVERPEVSPVDANASSNDVAVDR